MTKELDAELEKISLIMGEEWEVGSVKGGFWRTLFGQTLSLIRTYAYARKHGIEMGDWYGVYLKGEETIVATLGPNPAALRRAQLIVQLHEEDRKALNVRDRF